MDEKSLAFPLAFILALGASGTAAQIPTGSPDPFTPGSLRELAEQGATRLGMKLELPSASDTRKNIKLTQWYNGGPPMCFAGAWRRC
ncbi:MAG: hypothetical protein QOG66_3538 [Methylobacteriaceae bacterium]|jgi:hypothetical protein|nr:hypothetical protein [Methylobacteriaceae bacterium]